MSHYQRKLDPNFPLFVTGRCNNKEFFPIPLSECWEIMSDYLHMLKSHYGIEILSFVLMSNHFHLLCRDPHLNLSKGMSVFMRETSKEISRMANRINRVWGSPFHSSIITHPSYYLCAYKYSYRNPVAADLCQQVEQYPWSTLAMLLGVRGGCIPVEADETLFDDIKGTLDWLNEDYEATDASAIALASRKKVFKIARDKNTNRSLLLKNYALGFKNPGGGF